MIINYINIEKVSDLEQLFDVNIFLSGDTLQEQKETYENGWGIIIDYELAKKITTDDLAEFILELVAVRTKQVLMINPALKAILYFWFDELALQLCFNILSEENRSLPFGCKINIVDSPYPILKHFLKVVYDNALYGNYLEITEIVESDCGFNNDDNGIDLELFVIDVWKITLPWSDNE